MSKIKLAILSTVLITLFAQSVLSIGLANRDTVYAACPILPQTGTPDPNCLNAQQSSYGNGCVGLSETECLQQNGFIQKLQLIVNFLSAGVGLVVVAMVIFGGIKYITAGENAQAVQDAKNTIRNAIVALLVFALMFSFINWLIPGGIFA